MDSLYMDSVQRCVRHPHQRVVGVCAACLRERLSALADYSRLADAHIYKNLSGSSHDSLQVPPQTMRRARLQAAASQPGVSNAVDKKISEKNVPHRDNSVDRSRPRAAVPRPLFEETATMKARASGCSSSQRQKTDSYGSGTRRVGVGFEQACVKSPQSFREPCSVSQEAPDFGFEHGLEIEVVKKELEVQGPAPNVQPEASSFRFLLHEHPSKAVAINAHEEDEEENVGGSPDQGDKCLVDAVPTDIMQDCSDCNAAGDVLMTSYGRTSTDGIHVGTTSTDGVIERPSFGLGIDPNHANRCSSSRKKKTGSWFSLSKPKSVAQQNQASKLPIKIPSYVDENGVLLASMPARRSTTDQRSQKPHQDLHSIAEGDVSSASSSWIFSFFHIRRSSKARSLKSMLGDATAMETSTANFNGVRNGMSVHQSPKVSIDVGRLSWDGPRSNIRHILKKIEARTHSNKLQSMIDGSSHAINHQSSNIVNFNGSKRGNDVTLARLLAGETANHPFVRSLPKSKSVSSSRSDMIVDITELTASGNGGSSIAHQDYQNVARSHNAGHRGWTKALSPLLGRRQETQQTGPTCNG